MKVFKGVNRMEKPLRGVTHLSKTPGGSKSIQETLMEGEDGVIYNLVGVLRYPNMNL